MFKLVLEKAEEPEIKLLTSTGSSKNPLLTEADSPSDCDESGLGRWHGSQAKHLDRVRAVRLHTQTRRSEGYVSVNLSLN